jgi:hypothetical protein
VSTLRQAQSQSISRRRTRARWRGILALIVLLALLALLAVWGWQVYQAARLLRDDLRAAQALAGSAPDRQTLSKLGPLAARTRADAASLRAAAGPALPLTRYLGWVPVYGAQLQTAQPVLDAAVELSAAADQALQALAPLTQPGAASDLAAVARQLADARAQLSAARDAAARAQAAWAGVQIDTLPPDLRAQAARVDELLPVMRGALDLALVAPALVDDIAHMRALTQPQLDRARLPELGALLSKLRTDTTTVRAAAAPLLPLSPQLARYSPDLAQAAPLLRFAEDLAATGDQSFQALAPLLNKPKPGEQVTLSLAERLAAARPQIEQARAALARAEDDLTRLRLDALSPGLRGGLDPIVNLLPELRDGLDFAKVLPGLLGADGRREYLLLAQNPDELRATGGFISGAGILAIDRGRLAGFSIGDSVAVDHFFAGKPYPDPPEPLRRYMDIPLWVFRDTNWSPDFPTAARAALDLYRIGQDRAPTSVIAFDPAFTQQLLQITGPLPVEGMPAPIGADNVVPQLRSPEGLPGDPGREEFKRRLAAALFGKLERDGAQIDLRALARALRTALDQRHLLLYVDDPAASDLLAERGWDGAVEPGAGDFLMLVDSNVGYNKTSPNIATTISYTLDLRDPRAPLADLAVMHAHQVAGSPDCHQWGADPAIADGRAQYDDWMSRCYYDYMRVLIPGGSQLVDSQNAPTPAEWLMTGQADDGAVTQDQGEADTAELSTFVTVPRGESRTTQFRYQLPPGLLQSDARGWHYRLKIQKQPGTAATPVTVRVLLPKGAAKVTTGPAPSARAGDSITFQLALDVDRAVEVSFAAP